MSRLKRSSQILEKAERRMASLKSISSSLDLGNGLTIEAFTTSIEEARGKLEAYNTVLSMTDAAYTAMLEAEKSLQHLTEHMLIGVAWKYGKNSPEYEMAGGIRKSDRKRPTRKAKIEAIG